MTTYNTLNPVPSSEVKDLLDNTQTFDEVVNSKLFTARNRLGFDVKTLSGYQNDFNNFLINSGFESTHLVYVSGTALAVNRASQLIDYNGSVYKIKMPSSFPVTLTGNFATDSAKLIDVGDASLRQALASAGGQNLVYGLPDLIDKSKFRLFLNDFAGVIGNDSNNDTAGIQAAILAIATAGGGTLYGACGKKYYVPGTLLVPSNVTIDFCGAQLRLNRTASTNSTFVTATLENGILVSNLASANEEKLVYNTCIKNAIVKDAYRLFDFKNFILGCSLENIQTTNCLQVWKLSRCFYSSYVNISAAGGSDVATPTYFLTGQNNAMSFKRVSATTNYGWSVQGGSTAIHWDTCTYEGGALGFYVSGENHGLIWTALYAEAVQGTLFNFSDCSSISYRSTGAYINKVDIVMRDPEGAGAYCFGDWDQSNEIVNVGVTEGGFTYRGLFYQRGSGNASHVELRPVFSGERALPANVIFSAGGQTNIKQISHRNSSGIGDVLSKGVLYSGILPLHYSGDTGRTFNNQVAFCDHSPFSATVGTILVDTRIVLRDTTFAKYRFVVTDANGTYTLFGDIYGTNASPRDTTGKTVVVSAGPNGMRLELSTFTHPSGLYTCTGTVQLCT